MGHENQQLDIYRINTKDRIDKKRVLIIVLIILSIICISLAIFFVSRTVSRYKEYKIYEEQLKNLQQEEAQEQVRIDREKQAKLPKLTDEGRQNIEKIYKSDTKRAFLTFDDGPSGITAKLLDVLNQEKVKATFFVLGSNVEKRPDLVKRMYDEGHYVANHGYSHKYSEIYSSKEAVLDEYNRCNDAVKQAIGVPEYNSHLFRFPGGLAGGKYADIKAQANELLSQNDIVHVDWNALTGDSETNDLSIDFELKRLNETIQNKNSIVILMHDSPNKSVTVDALPQIIETLRNNGYEFKNFYEIIK